MAYTKTNWQNNITPANETNMNKIEDELETLDNDISNINDTIDDINDEIENLKPVILYENTTGSTNVSLNDSVANYDYIEIIFKENTNNKIYSTGKLFAMNGKKTTLSYIEVPSSATGNIYVFGAEYSINGTSIQITSSYGFCPANGSGTVDYSNRTSIISVIGYK